MILQFCLINIVRETVDIVAAVQRMSTPIILFPRTRGDRG